MGHRLQENPQRARIPVSSESVYNLFFVPDSLPLIRILCVEEGMNLMEGFVIGPAGILSMTTPNND